MADRRCLAIRERPRVAGCPLRGLEIGYAAAVHQRASVNQMPSCTHLDQIRITELPASVEGCEDCLQVGDPWLHLRICLECGKVGCCDDSPNRHATAHAHSSGHPLIRSLQPGETWSWCYVDEVALLLPQVTGETRIPPSPLGG
jgi:uncharacterized UBP type Zn finger protein